MNTYLIDILIPTYNRAQDLTRNIDALAADIAAERFEQAVRIVVSDNHSTDDTPSALAAAAVRYPDIALVHSRQPRNMGLEENAVTLLRDAEAPYIFWLGDDDYLAPGYLKFVVETLSGDPTIGSVFAGLAELHADGNRVPRRLEAFETRRIPSGYQGVWEYSHLAHQMSGLVLKRAGLYDDYISQPGLRSPYLFIHLLAKRMFDADSFYAPSYKTLVTVFNEKDWGYNDVGMLDEVYKCYFGFRNEIGERRLRDLLIRFTVMHSYRFGLAPFRLLRPMRQFHQLTQFAQSVPGFRRALAVLLLKDIALLHIRHVHLRTPWVRSDPP